MNTNSVNWIRERWHRILSALLALATVLALVPYESGWLSTLYPVTWKPWILGVGAISTTVSQMFGRKKEVAGPPPSTLIQNFYTFNLPTKETRK